MWEDFCDGFREGYRSKDVPKLLFLSSVLGDAFRWSLCTLVVVLTARMLGVGL